MSSERGRGRGHRHLSPSRVVSREPGIISVSLQITRQAHRSKDSEILTRLGKGWSVRQLQENKREALVNNRCSVLSPRVLTFFSEICQKCSVGRRRFIDEILFLYHSNFFRSSLRKQRTLWRIKLK